MAVKSYVAVCSYTKTDTLLLWLQHHPPWGNGPEVTRPSMYVVLGMGFTPTRLRTYLCRCVLACVRPRAGCVRAGKKIELHHFFPIACLLVVRAGHLGPSGRMCRPSVFYFCFGVSDPF